MDKELLAMLPTRNSQIIVPHHNTLLSGLRKNRKLVMDYVRDTQLPTTNTHPLLKFINAFPTGPAEPMDIWFRCRELGTRIARGMGINTAFNKGGYVDTVLFHNGLELVTLTNGEYPEDLEWWNWEPIKLVSHSYDNLTGDYLINNPSEVEEATISVDVGLLGLQYWYFQKGNLLAETPLRNDQYLRMYPLNNSLPSYLEIAVANYLLRSFADVPTTAFNPNLGPITLIDLRSRLQRFTPTFIQRMTRTQSTMKDFMLNFQCVDYTLWDLFYKGADELLTRHNSWVYLKNSTKYLVSLHGTFGLGQFDDNRRFISRLKVFLNRQRQAGRFKGFDDYVENRLIINHEKLLEK